MLFCEYFGCNDPAVAQVTVPHLMPRMCNCEAHLQETLELAKRYRKVPGAVSVDPISLTADTCRRAIG